MRHWRRKPRPDDPPGLPSYNLEQLELQAATKRNLTPLAWRQQPEDDRARMLAFDLKESTVEAYAAEYREDYHKKHGDKGEADREFRAMQREKQLEKRGG